ncbi:hypothetical protein BJ742DRAFT_766450 [Cladochytrium replicatum]|nr:hypothetical protein BJ742DRAFT_766450 [Cladochytrium replicatum]
MARLLTVALLLVLALAPAFAMQLERRQIERFDLDESTLNEKVHIYINKAADNDA